MDKPDSVRVAVVQASGAPCQRDATVDAVCAATADAAGRGAKLVLLPEAFVGGYPWGLTFGTTVGGRSEAGRRVWERYWSNAIDVPGPELERMGSAAEQAGVHLCVGVVEPADKAETAPSRAIVNESVFAGTVIPGCNAKPLEVTISPDALTEIRISFQPDLGVRLRVEFVAGKEYSVRQTDGLP